MITASGSSRLTQEAIPTPSIFTARSISVVARSSPCFERPLPDAAGEPVAAPLLHDLEELGLGAVLDLLAGLDLHREPARVGLHAALATARAARAAALDDHVADLAGGAPADPGLAVQDQPAADAGTPPDAEDRVELPAGAQLELALNRHLDVVAHPHRHAELVGQVLAEREGAGPARQVAGVGDDAGRSRRRRPAIRSRRRSARGCRSPPAPRPRAAPPRSPARRPPVRRWSGSGAATPPGPCGRRRRRRSGSWFRPGRCRRAEPGSSRGSRRNHMGSDPFI